MARVPLVVHERLGTWARQLRPRVVAWPVRLTESRSANDMVSAIGVYHCPLLVIDLGQRVRAGLEDLDRAMHSAPNALALVLDSGSHAGVCTLAKELGATLVLPADTPPPAVVSLLARWLKLARRRAEADGWAGDPVPELEPWELPPFTTARVTEPRVGADSA